MFIKIFFGSKLVRSLNVVSTKSGYNNCWEKTETVWNIRRFRDNELGMKSFRLLSEQILLFFLQTHSQLFGYFSSTKDPLLTKAPVKSVKCYFPTSVLLPKIYILVFDFILVANFYNDSLAPGKEAAIIIIIIKRKWRGQPGHLTSHFAARELRQRSAIEPAFIITFDPASFHMDFMVLEIRSLIRRT